MIRTFRYRLKPTSKQARVLSHVLAVSTDLYNAALQERRDAWRMQRKSVTYFDQTRQLTEIRAEDADIAAIPVHIAREPLRRVNRAFRDFFHRCKKGERPGYPRFRSHERYNSFSLSAPDFRVDGNRLYLVKLGGFLLKLHRPLRGVQKHLTVVRSGKRWAVSMVCDVGEPPPKVAVSKPIGIDLGLNTFAVLSDGQTVESPRFFRLAEAEVSRANQNLARKRRGSNNRKRAKLRLHRVHERIANRRSNFCHHVSRWLVSNYDLIAFEDLDISRLVQSNLAKSIHDAAWGMLIGQVRYKAEDAGAHAVAVDPRGTTQRCARCGATVQKDLKERTHRCLCGFVADRDHNAALNILALGRSVVGLAPAKVHEKGHYTKKP